MKLASRIGIRDGLSGLGDALIRWRLRGGVSHCEVVFEPGDGVDELMPDGTSQPDDMGRLWCASSVGLERLPEWSYWRAGRIGGLRLKRIDISDTNTWELDVVRTSAIPAAAIARRCEGVRYDWRFIFGFFAWPISQQHSRLACSEACALMLGFPEPHRFDPCGLRAAVRAMK